MYIWSFVHFLRYRWPNRFVQRPNHISCTSSTLCFGSLVARGCLALYNCLQSSCLPHLEWKNVTFGHHIYTSGVYKTELTPKRIFFAHNAEARNRAPNVKNYNNEARAIISISWRLLAGKERRRSDFAIARNDLSKLYTPIYTLTSLQSGYHIYYAAKKHRSTSLPVVAVARTLYAASLRSALGSAAFGAPPELAIARY